MMDEEHNATAPPWRSCIEGGQLEEPRLVSGGHTEALPTTFFARDAEDLARDLLGCLLVSEVDGMKTAGAIVEVEAYMGSEDPASHARAAVGRTRRNDSMFGPPGIAYVYRSYGIHWCMNVVAGAVDDPVAVLLRALDPVEGQGVMAERRGRATDLCSGPGRLTQALGITDAHDGHDLSRGPLRLLRGWEVDEASIGVSPRIGISRAVDWPLRFYVRKNPSVSRSPST